ncbi:MAG: AIR synthase-related protein, partial [Planctomycetota bacterium]
VVEPGRRDARTTNLAESLPTPVSGEGQGVREGRVPQLDPQTAKKTFAAMHRAIHAGLVRACHDLSEGGLAVAAAEMAFAGGFGAKIDLQAVPCDDSLPSLSGTGGEGNQLPSPSGRGAGGEGMAARLFSESNTRFLCEVQAENVAAFETAIAGAANARIGQVTQDDRLVIHSGGATVVESDLASLKEAWQKPLRW